MDKPTAGCSLLYSTCGLKICSFKARLNGNDIPVAPPSITHSCLRLRFASRLFASRLNDESVIHAPTTINFHLLIYPDSFAE